MEGRITSVLFILLLSYVSAQTSDSETLQQQSSLVFHQYLALENIKSGKVYQDLLNPGNVLIAHNSAISRLVINGTDFSTDVILGSEEESSIVDDIGTDARFDHIFELAQIPDKKIWIVSELTYNCLRKIDVDTLEVSTYSGRCNSGAEKNPRVGPVSEATWSLPGFMAYMEAEKKLYVASDSHLRVIDMETDEVEVVGGEKMMLYDLIATARSTLLILGAGVLNELDPADPSNPTKLWSKDDDTDLGFSFIYDVAKIDEERVILADDTKGLWLLNIESKELQPMCPGDSMTLVTGEQQKCYEAPSRVQDISYIYNNLYIMSHWSKTDIGVDFELGIFIGSSVPSVDDAPPVVDEMQVEGMVNETTTLNSTTEISTMDISTTENSTTEISTTDNSTMVNSTNAEAGLDGETANTTMVTPEIQTETSDMPDESSTETIYTNDTSTSMNDTTKEDMNSTTAMPDDYVTDITTEEGTPRSLFTTTEPFVTDSNEDFTTKYPEEKTPEIPTSSEKPGKGEAGQAKENAAGERVATSFISWSIAISLMVLSAC